MPSRQARRLSEAHRLAQLRLGAITVARLRLLWPLLDPAHLDDTFEGWVTSIVPVVADQRRKSAVLAGRYLTVFKTLELGLGASVSPFLADTVHVPRLTTSLLVTGPVSIKKAMTRGVTLQDALDIAEGATAAVGMRHALDGGRDTITQTVKADPDARGWVRVASGNACAFCVSLTAPDVVVTGFEAHPGCSCTADPVYAAA